MKAVVLNEIGGELQLQEVEAPRPGKEQVLIKVQACGVNFADSQMRLGLYPMLPQTPVIPGVEVAGTIIETGADVDASLVGKRVVAVLFSTGGFGGYAEYAVASVYDLIELPDNVSYEDALAVPIQGLSAYFLLTESAKVTKKDTILIHASAGGVGSIAVQLARILGITEIFATASNESKLALTKSLGAKFLVNYTDSDWTDQILKATCGKGVDIILSSATDDVSKQSLKVLAPYGKFVAYGSLDVKTSSFAPDQIMQLIFNNQSLIGFYIGLYSSIPGNFKKACTYLLYLISTGALKITTQDQYFLADAQQAHEDMANRKTIGKVTLKINV